MAARRAPHRRRRTDTATVQLARRAQEPFAHGEDPDAPQVGPIRIEAIRPLREVRLVLDDPDLDFAFDLTYESRFPPVATDRNTIEREGQIVTDYMNFFQPGLYSGWVRADGEERRVERRAGFRDRGWGLRKHEGAARRGMHIFTSCELAEESLYMLIYETAQGGACSRTAGDPRRRRRRHRRADGTRAALRRAPADLRPHAGDTRAGATRTIEVDVEGRMWMEAVGYTAVPGRGDPGADRLDLTDPDTYAGYQGLFDYGCRITVDGDGATATSKLASASTLGTVLRRRVLRP